MLRNKFHLIHGYLELCETFVNDKCVKSHKLPKNKMFVLFNKSDFAKISKTPKPKILKNDALNKISQFFLQSLCAICIFVTKHKTSKTF